MTEKEYISLDTAYDIGTLEDWYINSVSQDDTPVWTEEHLEELFNDFYVIPKDTLIADVTPIRHGHWIDKPYPNYPAHDIRYCSECGWNIHKSKLRNSDLNWSYCPNCGADIRGDNTE
jgi:predicted RNA-binding Zn-ribbon protein involved in translation (DUF1610 family)